MRNIDNSVRVGNISNAAGIAIGPRAQAQGTYLAAGEQAQETARLISELRAEIAAANIPDSAKQVLLTRALPQMEQAVASDDPRPALERGLERVNDQLEGVGAVAENVSGIADKVMKIAQIAGIAAKTVAPFIASIM